MKRKSLLLISVLIGIAVIGVIVLYIGTGISVKSNIKHCQALYSGPPEDALVAYMLDESQHPENRSHIAIWTLAQIESEKALPYLKELYQDDPKGKTCKGKHDTMLCQYEIYKAIQSIEKGRMISYARLKE